MNLKFNKLSSKEALGLAVSGTEVRLAYLVNQKGQIRIEGLERAKLRSSLEVRKAAAEKPPDFDQPENADAFGLKDGAAAKKTAEQELPPDNANMEVLYALLDKFTKKKVKIAFNVPLSMANYQAQMPVSGTVTGIERDPGLNMAQYLMKPGQSVEQINLFYEKFPSTLALMLEVRNFTRGNLYLAQMSPTETALVNLARASVELEEGKITAMVNIEENFSRLLFLRGKEILHISALINESASSPDILEVVYRRLIYEQDEAQIPEINAILLAGKGCRMRAKEFFAQHCTGVEVSYLATNRLGNFPANDTQRAVFSEFAVAIGLAWQLLEPRNSAFVPLDLLPSEVKDQQEVLKLGYPGYALLGLTGLVAFFFTWQILALTNEIDAIRSQNNKLEEQIKNNQATVDRVYKLEDECKRLNTNLALADTLSKGHDEFLHFTQKLNRSVLRTGNVWVEEISRQNTGFSIRGGALQRERIPILAEQLEQASLRQVTRAENGKQKFFQFELERQNLQNKFEFSAGGIRIIDANDNGKLILGKENEKPSGAPAPTGTAANNTSGPPSARPENMNNSRNNAEAKQANGLIKEASNTRPLAPANKEPEKKSAATTPAKPETPRTTPPKEQNKTLTAQNHAQTGTANAPSASKEKSGASNGASANPALVKEQSKAAAPNSAAAEITSAQLASKEKAGAGNGTNLNTAPVKEQNAATKTPGNTPPAAKDKTGAGSNAAPAVIKPEQQPSSEKKSAVSPNAVQPSYRLFSIEAATSPRQDFMVELKDAYVRQGYKAALGTYYDEKQGQKAYRVLIGLYNSRVAAEQAAAGMGKLLMQGHRIVGVE